MGVAPAAGGPRPAVGALVGAALVALITAGLVPFRDDITRAGPALAFVLAVVIAGVIGGRAPAVLSAFIATAGFNLAFIPPYWTLKIHAFDDVIALAVFTVVGVAVGTLVGREADRRQAAEERARELQALNEQLRIVQSERERLAEEATRVAVLERVDKQRAALLRSVSHDLRTPLATIRAVTSDLRAGAAFDDATRAELLELVGDEAERLDRLVANLLSLSRIEAGALKPDRQAVALDELSAHCVNRLDRLFRHVRVEVNLPDELPFVDADYSQLDQLLSNLLENAARHAPPASTVRIGARHTGACVEAWVDDEGYGVTPFERRRIFEPFRRSQGSSSSGMGLAICKAIVEAHGGEICVREAPGGGARFVFTLPVRRG